MMGVFLESNIEHLFLMSSYRAEKCLELVHADLCGHISPKTIGGASYFLLVVDDIVDTSF